MTSTTTDPTPRHRLTPREHAERALSGRMSVDYLVRVVQMLRDENDRLRKEAEIDKADRRRFGREAGAARLERNEAIAARDAATKERDALRRRLAEIARIVGVAS